MGPVARAVLGAPRHLYLRGWGWLLGHRFLMLTHVGRRSGRTYRTVLEVVRWDPLTREVTVASGFGPRADWLLNLRAGGEAEVTIARDTFVAVPRFLTDDEAAEVMAAYERRNAWMLPVVRLVLSRLVGWRYDGSPDGRRRLVAQLPFIALRPR